MCGFTGSISFEKIDNNAIINGNKLIECRGPDSQKSYSKKLNKLNIELIFNRLSILDLSDEANQPMHSPEFRTTLLFNGEIFNHKELRRELVNRGLSFRTSHSDSETVLMGLSFYGLDFLQKLRGQFAIFFMDEKIGKAYLIRDRLGQKPIYYFIDKKKVLFGSSLFSLLKIQNDHKLSTKEVFNYIKYGVVNSPNTLFENFYKVQPAEVVELNFNEQNFSSRKYLYWEPSKFINNKKFDEDEFFNILSQSINIRSSADVPVANFLSGGIDSTAIVKNLFDTDNRINTFSVIFDNSKYDESRYINKVVEKYDTNHNSILISSNIDNSDIFKSLECLDEPYSDPSIVPSFILSSEISKHYKVAISGDGGDELLGGYDRTINTLKPKTLLGNFYSALYRPYPPFLGTGNKFLSKSLNFEKSYRSYIEDQKLLNLLGIEGDVYEYANNLNSDGNLYKKLLLADYKFYLPEMMMFKVDRTSMTNSLEVRSPFVDHNLIEYILSSSTEYVDQKSSKAILKKYINQDFGTEFTNRKKQGFVFDVEKWIYNNINLVKNYIHKGEVTHGLNSNFVNYLSIRKSRINGQRIWKMFILEEYLNRVKKL